MGSLGSKDYWKSRADRAERDLERAMDELKRLREMFEQMKDVIYLYQALNRTSGGV